MTRNILQYAPFLCKKHESNPLLRLYYDMSGGTLHNAHGAK